MRNIYTVFLLFAVSTFSFPQSTNKAQLKSGIAEVPVSSTNKAQLKSGIAGVPVSRAVLPQAGLSEIGDCTIKIGETRNIADLAKSRTITQWSSSTPESVRVTGGGDITGVSIGNAFIQINQTEYISVAVVPSVDFYIVSDLEARALPSNSNTGDRPTANIEQYRTEPTFRLAWKFNNRGENWGASGGNGGIDILGRGDNYEWLWTTFWQGGWFYDLNGVKREMVNGFQRDNTNNVELTVKPVFVYAQGVPYLQLTHTLHNTGDTAVSGQRFGASADVMIHNNDNAALIHTPAGAYMTDSATNPTLELLFVGESAEGITPVDTLWLGEWGNGEHLSHIYDDSRADVPGVDSAIGFSYQNISLDTGESKEFVVRFTLARPIK
ncbi:hypothetical protein ACYULU_10145 [Breznakiellaceae bacterium SP9]